MMSARASAIFAVLALTGCAGGQGGLAQNPLKSPQPNTTLIVRPDGGAYTYFDGAAAKAQAVQVCAGRGKVLNPAAFGQFSGGAWQFAGGCV